MTDEEGIRRTLARYCQLCDDGSFDEFAKLFTDDAEFHVLGQVHTGRDAIRSFMAAAQPPERRGKHVATNSVINVNGHEAHATTDYIFVGRDKSGEAFAITSVGRYHDRFVRAEGKWRFARREIVFLGDEPLA